MNTPIKNKATNSSGIYYIKNTLNDKVYYGSAVNINNRRQRHLTALRNKTHDNQKLQNDFNKCGEEVFVFEVLELIEDVNQLLTIEEKYLKENWNNRDKCYNILKHAGNSLGYKHTEMSKQKISGVNNPMYGKSGFKSPKAKPVYQYSIEGKFIRKYDTLTEASKENNIKIGHISSATKGRNEVIGGYRWRSYQTDNIGKYINPQYKLVVKIDPVSGEQIEVYESIAMAGKMNNTNSSNICGVLSGKCKTCAGFYWKYFNEDRDF